MQTSLLVMILEGVVFVLIGKIEAKASLILV